MPKWDQTCFFVFYFVHSFADHLNASLLPDSVQGSTVAFNANTPGGAPNCHALLKGCLQSINIILSLFLGVQQLKESTRHIKLPGSTIVGNVDLGQKSSQ